MDTNTLRDQVPRFAPLAVAIETSQGTVVDQLLRTPACTLFPINPRSARAYRDRKAPSGTAPVSYQSGPIHRVRFRGHCNKALRSTLHLWANLEPLFVPLGRNVLPEPSTAGQIPSRRPAGLSPALARKSSGRCGRTRARLGLHPVTPMLAGWLRGQSGFGSQATPGIFVNTLWTSSDICDSQPATLPHRG